MNRLPLKYIFSLLLTLVSAVAFTQEIRDARPVAEDSLSMPAKADSVLVIGDSICVDPDEFEHFMLPRLSEFKDIHRDPSLNKLQKMREYGNFFVRVIDAFDTIDSTYVERIGYNFTAMLQATTNYEFYSLGTRDYVHSLAFAQHPDLRIGPYFGWRWLFFGYTFDISHLGQKSIKTGRKFEFSIYTSMLDIDLIYRKTGSDFFLRRVRGLSDNAIDYEGQDCRFIDASVIGANIYYNINHRRFSSPAVFSQSTIQRRSAGSWQVGASVTHHDIHYNYSALPEALRAETPTENQFRSLERLKYIDYSLTGGYAYNWVFHRGWCLGVSVTPAIGYKRTSTKTVLLEEEEEPTPAHDSSFLNRLDEIFRRRGNVNFDVTGRLGLIYNTGRWFVGAFGVLHNYNYHRGDLKFSNTFGNANLCVGFYFHRKRTPSSPDRPVREGGARLGL